MTLTKRIIAALATLSMLLPVQAMASDLIGMLTSGLGISQQQAEGGAGTIFQAAKPKLSGSDFSQLSGIVPNMGSLLAAAPKTDATAGTASNLAGLAGGLLGGSEQSATSQLVGQLGEMTGAFSALGMRTDQVTPFVDIVLNYVKSQGGQGLMNSLQTALGMSAAQPEPQQDLISKGLDKLKLLN